MPRREAAVPGCGRADRRKRLGRPRRAVRWLPLAAGLLLACGCQAADYAWPVVRILDGDTVEVDAAGDLPPELARVKVRFQGVDTPERGRNASCEKEKRAAEAAAQFTASRLRGAESVVFRGLRWGKYARVVAEAVVDGRSLSRLLIRHGHGRSYDGKSSRRSWCD